MPVDFAHCTGLDGDECGAELGGDGEGLRVDDLDGTAIDFVGRLLGEVVGIRLITVY